MLTKATAVLLFLWGCVWLFAMSHFVFLWAIDPSSPVRHECAMGLGMAFMFGIPAWAFLPMIASHRINFPPIATKAMKGMAILALVEFLFSMAVMA